MITIKELKTFIKEAIEDDLRDYRKTRKNYPYNPSGVYDTLNHVMLSSNGSYEDIERRLRDEEFLGDLTQIVKLLSDAKDAQNLIDDSIDFRDISTSDPEIEELRSQIADLLRAAEKKYGEW